ncbi:hypothetical protein [Mesonia mobilis]|uniref:hypothetical protein n=1 Tax=Mesonia mobilis TaxID=369791 RepID=UPI0024BB6A09|nr:hypothetical protein [Mesonia mobilis]
MNKITKTKAFTLISVGLLVIAASQITSHYITLPDMVQGAFVGVGLGLLLMALYWGNIRRVQ